VSRRIVILDVTAMGGDSVCVAGIDLTTKQTSRLNEPQPTRRILAALGGLSPGDIIEVNAGPVARPERPHVEDCHWLPRSLKKVGRMSVAEMAAFVSGQAFDSIEAAFDAPAPRTSGRNRGWPMAVGDGSLASLRVQWVRFHIDPRAKVRATFRDMGGDYWEGVPFQDLSARSHETACVPCKTALLENLKRDFQTDATTIRVGLTRPFAASADQPGLCWLQVTNVLARDRRHF
jgi:hypothetical protein